MSADGIDEDQQEITRLQDEVEQLRTSLEAAFEESSRLAEDRDRLLKRVTEQARELQAVNLAYERARTAPSPPLPDLMKTARNMEADEELRVAFEEMQVLTEELEAANTTLQENNKQLDRRVEERTRELERKNVALQQSELRFRTLIEGMPQLVWRSLEQGEWTWASPQWETYTGLSAEESKSLGWLRAIHPDDRKVAQGRWKHAKPGAPLEFDARIYHRGERRYRHFKIRALAARNSAGELIEWLGTSTDVDDLLTLQHQQSVLVTELQHRTRNLMGVVQSMLSRTMAGSSTLEDFQSRIGHRIAALARVQGLLSRRGEGQRVTVDELLREEVSAHIQLDRTGRGAQVTVSGPTGIELRSADVQTLALAIHELMTNAVKYGALSAPKSHLDVSWEIKSNEESGSFLRIDWRESGVPSMPSASAPAQGSGYGRELIERALPYQLGARTSYTFAADGVCCSIELEVPDRTVTRSSFE